MNRNYSKIENTSTTIFFMRNMKINVSTVRIMNSYNRIFGSSIQYTMNNSLDI